MREKALGEQESAVLRFVTERGGATVGEAAEGFGGPNSVTRSTVVTVMERLRAKGYLTRNKGNGGVFQYFAAQPQEEILGGVVARFIEKTLGGRMTAFSAHFTRSERLSADEKIELRRLLEKLEGNNAEEGKGGENNDE